MFVDGADVCLRGAAVYVGALEKMRVKEAGVESLKCCRRESVLSSVNEEGGSCKFVRECCSVVV